MKELTAAAKATATAPIWTKLIGLVLIVAPDVLAKALAGLVVPAQAVSRQTVLSDLPVVNQTLNTCMRTWHNIQHCTDQVPQGSAPMLPVRHSCQSGHTICSKERVPFQLLGWLPTVHQGRSVNHRAHLWRSLRC